MRFFGTCIVGYSLLTTNASAETLTHQGRLLDSLGTPVNGVYTAQFGLTDGSAVWVEEQTLTFEDGYYSVVLGADAAASIPDSLFASASLALELSIDGVLSTSMPIHAVPRSVHSSAADHATSAGHADSADTATLASSATSAGFATTAGSAATATSVAGGTAAVSSLQVTGNGDIDGTLDVAGHITTTGHVSARNGLYAGSSGSRALAYASSAVANVAYNDGEWFTIWQPGDHGTFIFSVAFDSNGEGGAIWNYRAGGFVSVGQTAMNNGNATDVLDFNWSAHATNGRTVEFRFLMPCCQNPGVVQMRVNGESLSSPMPLYTNWVRMF